jgi:hypothetical protein
MSITLAEVQTEVLQRLGDSAGAIWSESEIEGYIQEAYDELTAQTGCLFDMALFPDVPLAFSYTADWERDHILDVYNSGWAINGQAAFTSEFERDWVDNQPGPGNHNHVWEEPDETLIAAIVDLPEDLYEIERATWNTKRIDPLRTRHIEHSDSRYELSRGSVEGYLQDKDGVNRLRKWRVPSSPYVPYEFDSDSDDADDGFGIIRDLGDISDADVI